MSQRVWANFQGSNGGFKIGRFFWNLVLWNSQFLESLDFESRGEILKNVDFLLWANFLWSIWTRSKIDVIRGCIFLNTLPLAVYLHISMVLNILPLAVSCQYSWMRSDKFMSTFFHCNKSYHLLSIVNAHWWKVPYYCVPNISA